MAFKFATMCLSYKTYYRDNLLPFYGNYCDKKILITQKDCNTMTWQSITTEKSFATWMRKGPNFYCHFFAQNDIECMNPDFSMHSQVIFSDKSFL
jgi:hypothetical protein